MRNNHTDIFYLQNREYVTPHYIRLTLKGRNSIEPLGVGKLGVNNKIFIPQEGESDVVIPEFDFSKMKWKPLLNGKMPHMRTFTHRGMDLERNELYLEFAIHGDEGPASNFAINAPIGSQLGISTNIQYNSVYPLVKDYVLVGDATAIPLFSCILEELPPDTNVHAIIEVVSSDDIQNFKTEVNLSYEWIINPSLGKKSFLFNKLSVYVENYLNSTSKFAYVAAELNAVKEVRAFLKENKWERHEFVAMAYWKYGKTESMAIEEMKEDFLGN